MQVINKITGKDITKEINDKFIQEIIASGRKYIDSSGNEVKLK
jgi:hypothetical protein|tara:strand:+ start:841 stop:969 length:129 start_codon:yes stop_codon:yes gene_type:complete